ncbi:MAG: hypothetical protein V4617_20875 [Gemmatimonadota bacterium]
MSLLHLEDDAPLRRVLYVAAFLLLVVPFIQAFSAQGMLPLQLGSIPWRFGAANQLTSILLLPYLGLALMLFVGRSVGSRATAMTVGVLSAIFAVGLAACGLLFVLDGLQLKKIVQSAQLSQFNMAFVRVLAMTVLFAITFALLALAGLRKPKGTRVPVKKGVKQPVDDGPGLIVGREYVSAE